MAPIGLDPGTVVASRYRILGPCGSGGMGEVYAAADDVLPRRVALKVVRPERRLDATSRARLLREAQVLAQLDHPNICRIHDYIPGDELDFVVLELLEGRTLKEVLDSGPLEKSERGRMAGW